MRGTVLGFDIRSSEGKISGDDGARYRFAGAEWHGKTAPHAGQKIDFEAAGADALAIYPIGATGRVASYDRNRVTAALLAFFFGWFGVHKFYIGKPGAGFVMLFVAAFGLLLAGLPTMVMGVVALIEFVIYIAITDEQFDATYVKGAKAWF